jgi:hypothetical protein
MSISALHNKAASTSRVVSSTQQNGSLVTVREVILLIAWLLTCSSLMFWRSFHVSYGFDDIAHLHALACYRTGQLSFTEWLLFQHNEHIVPLVRLYFLAATKISGLSSAALHVMIVLNYVAGAFGCAWISFSLTRSRLGAFLAGTIFAAAGGFCGSTVWQPTDGQFSIAGTPLILAVAILVSPYARKRWADAAVLLLVVVSAMGMAAISVAALSIPVYILLAKPDTMSATRRKSMVGLSVLLTAAILLVTRWLMALHGVAGPQFALKGIYDGLFLVFITTGRFLLSWITFGHIGLPIAIAASVIGWILLVLTLRWVGKPLRTLLLALWVGDVLLAVLIGMGRYKTTTALDLFARDRYHYFFLLALALQTAAVLDHVIRRLLSDATPKRKRVVVAAFACFLLIALVMSHVRLDKSMIWYVINEHQLDFREAKVLAKIVRATAAKQNLRLADGPIRFPGSLNEHLGFSAIIYTQFPNGLPRVEWNLSTTPIASVGWPYQVAPISNADAAVENEIFDQWSKRINRPPYSCVLGGKVRDVLPVTSCAEAVKLPQPPLVPVVPFN